jgi:hypothetical protein
MPSLKVQSRNLVLMAMMMMIIIIIIIITSKMFFLTSWFGHIKRMPGNRLPLKILEWEPEGMRRRGKPKERWIGGVRRSMTNHGLTEEDNRDRDRWRDFVLGEGKPL